MTMDRFAALLGAREKELSAIYENVPGIVFYIAVEPDSEFRFLSVSRDFLTATGLSREQVVGSLVRDVIPPPSRDMVLSRYREAIRSGQPVRWEEESVYPTGQKYGEVAVTPLYDASGLATHLIGIVHDITERRRLEQRRAEDLLEAAPDAMVVVDQTGAMILVNAQTERLFGYSRQEILGRNVELLIPLRFNERHQAHRSTFFSEPRVRPMGAGLQLFGLRRDGTEFPVEIRLSPIHASEGILVTGAIRDITERKLAEEALRASEERLRLAQWAAHIGTFDLNLRTGVDIWQPETEALYGLPAGGFGGTLTAFENLIHHGDRERIVKLTQEMLKTGQPTEGEWRVVWPDGSLHWIASRGQVFMDESGEPSRMIGVNMDITDRKLAEQQLATANERLHLAIESGSVGGWDYDLKTGKNVWFGKAHAQLGMTPDQTLGSQEEFWARVHEEDREHLEHAIKKAKDSREEFVHEFRVVWRDGTTHWLRSRGRYYYGANGEPERMLGISIDVTERKHAEEALTGMTRKLVEAQEQERIRIARELHDSVNQRLALLAIALRQLQDNPSQVQLGLEKLEKETIEISDDVHALSHDLHSSQLEYLGVVRAMKSWCKEFGERKRIQISYGQNVRSTLPPKIGLCLFRVLQEALHNAAEHSGVKQIEVQLCEVSDEIHLVVHDSGKGFDIEAARQGPGLGLTSMLERVRLVKGRINIHSETMAGTTIDVCIPLAEDAGEQAS